MFTGIVEETGHSDFLDHPGRLRFGQKKYSVEPGSETVLR